MRHGDAADAREDAQRPLSEKGVKEARQAGEFLSIAKESPLLIWHSELLRAKQTAGIVAKSLNLSQNLRGRAGLRPEDSAEDFAREIETDAPEGGVMVVGHMPFVADLASLLLAGSASFLSLRFTTGALLCLERTGWGAWIQCYHLPAKLIARILHQGEGVNSGGGFPLN